MSEVDWILVCRHDDPHLPLVIKSVTGRSERLTTVLLGLPAHDYDIQISPQKATVRVEDALIDLSCAAKARLLSLPFAVNRPPSVQTTSPFSAREWEASLGSIWRIWGGVNPKGWLIHPNAIELQDAKPYLLWLAATLQVPVPPWLIARRVLAHAGSGRIVCKAVNAWQEVSAGRYLTTTLVPEDLIGSIDNPLETPTLTQQYVAHSEELRLYLTRDAEVGAQLQLIDSDEHITDFRTASREQLGCQVVSDIPPSIPVDGLRQLMTIIGINYCVFDFLQAGSGYVLTDINPCGSWAYLQGDFGVDLTDHILEGLQPA